jgi:hypothetical protein
LANSQKIQLFFRKRTFFFGEEDWPKGEKRKKGFSLKIKIKIKNLPRRCNCPSPSLFG